jgi:hypothetical protein
VTATEQRDADEALGRLSRQLQAQADRLDLSVSKGYLHGEWTVYVTSLSSTLSFIEAGRTESEALDKVLDHLNRIDLAVT